MKTCLSCNITYDDSKNFCKKCGNALADDHKLESKEAAKKQVFEDRLKIDPLNTGLLHEYAKFLFGNSLHKDAIAVLLKILALDEKDETATDLLFQSYQNLQMHKEAGETGKQLLAFKPGDIFLYESLIVIFAALNNSTETLGLCDHVLNTEPKNVVALYHKALIMLEENDLPKACAFFKQAYDAGQKDQITVIYTSIHHALKAEFKQAVDLLLPCLDKEQDYAGNINIQRGVLYMAFSLSKTTADLSHVKQWFAEVDPALLRKNNFPQDETAVVEITKFVIDESLNKISDSADAKYELGHLIKTYLGVDYFSAESSPVMAGLWYKVGSKEAELVSVSDAIISFQQAVELMPEEAKYTEALARAKAELAQIQKKRKRKQVLTYATALGFIALIIGAVFLYKYLSEINKWETAIKKNTVESFAAYITEYPKGRRSMEAYKLLEEAHWNKVKETHTIEGYQSFIYKYSRSKYASEANNLIEELYWNQVKAENSISAYENYKDRYINGKYLKEANRLKEDAFWHDAMIKNTPKAYSDYLITFPEGRYRNESLRILTLSDARIAKTHKVLKKGEHKISMEAGEVSGLIRISSNRFCITSTRSMIIVIYPNGIKKKLWETSVLLNDEVFAIESIVKQTITISVHE